MLVWSKVVIPARLNKMQKEIIYPKTHSLPKKLLIICGAIVLLAGLALGVTLILDKLPSNAAVRQVVPPETQEQLQNTLPTILNR